MQLEDVFRRLLQRDDIIRPTELMPNFARLLAWQSLGVDSEGNRLPAARLTHDILEPHGTAFPLLASPTARGRFLIEFVFGLKEASIRYSEQREQVSNFADWCHRVWRELHSIKEAKKDRHRVVLFALAGLPNRQRAEPLRTYWWACMLPMFMDIMAHGDRSDVFHILFSLYTGDLNKLISPAELFDLIKKFLDRLDSGIQMGTINLDETDPEAEDRHSWLEIAGYGADSIEAMRRDGRLVQESNREQAYQLLTRLASEPLSSRKAKEILRHLQE
jgi:hypothetical protein